MSNIYISFYNLFFNILNEINEFQNLFRKSCKSKVDFSKTFFFKMLWQRVFLKSS